MSRPRLPKAPRRRTIADDIIDAIEREGQLTMAELCGELGMHRNSVSAVVCRLHKKEVIHIAGWAHETEGAKIYPRPIYRIGARRDSPRPPIIPPAERAQRYRDRHLVKIAAKRAHQKTGVADPFFQLLLMPAIEQARKPPEKDQTRKRRYAPSARAANDRFLDTGEMARAS